VLALTPSGMNTVHRTPSRRAAHAAASPAFPPDAITQCTRAPRASRARATTAESPRCLNEWQGWRFCHAPHARARAE
jgi:hypothetical protein